MARAKFSIGGVGRVALAALLAASPLGMDSSGDGFRLEPAKAYAKGGDDDGDRGGRSDDGDRGGRGGDGDRGGRGGDGDRGGRGGHGGRDDQGGRDDHGGDRGDRDHDRGDRGDRHGGHDDRGHDRSGRDDRGHDRGDGNGRGRGRGRGGDDGRHEVEDARHGHDRRGGERRGGGNSDGIQVTKVEETPSGIEVEYSNGAKEEIENGRYERKDAFGRTVLERPASAKDFGRIRSNVVNSGLDLARPAAASRSRPGTPLPPDARARKVERGAGGIEVRYQDGWKEEIGGGRYQLKDPNNRTVVERRATQADHDRLMALAGR